MAAVAFVRDPANSQAYAIDPRRIVLVGHSTGGMIAAIVVAGDAELSGLVLISASDDAAYQDDRIRGASLEFQQCSAEIDFLCKAAAHPK